MKTKNLSETAVCMALSLCAIGLFSTLSVADEVEVVVTNTPGYVQLNAASAVQKLVPGTFKQNGYPSDLETPIFWFDCQRTNGWTFADGGAVAKIPSLVGDRYLATDTEGGIHRIAWTSVNPVFVAADSELGGPVLDFGVKGSKMAMSFNPVGPEGTTTNMLDGIGTVVAVWYSAVGDGADGQGGYYGGALLGGGFGRDGIVATDKSQYLLYRLASNDRQAPSTVAGDTGRPRWYDNPMYNTSHTHASILSGMVRQDGQHVFHKQVGFSGGWEVVSLMTGTHYGLFNATGLGMNDSRISAVSGGFKVAEMLIFGSSLSESDVERLEVYLNAKWFGRTPRGWNGRLCCSQEPISVPSMPSVSALSVNISNPWT